MERYLKVEIMADPVWHEFLMAELDLLQYDSFRERENVLEAYILEHKYVPSALRTILEKYKLDVEPTVERLENINWNEKWEASFHPVRIEESVLIRGSFHDSDPTMEFDVIINPKMSFGTGHHATTHLMVAEQLQIDHKGKDVLDIGTGTGILAIMASKLGAKSITVTDIDNWSIQNSKENFEINQVDNLTIMEGSIDNLTFKQPYDIIYANINKNVLLEELALYAAVLKNGGILLLSGFYSEDLMQIQAHAQISGLHTIHYKTSDNWALLRLSSTVA